MKWNLNQRIKIEPQHLNIYSCTCIHVRCIIILVLYMASSCLNVVDNSIICLICIYLHQHNLVFEIYWLCLWGKEGETTQTMKSTSQTWHWCVSWWMMQVHLVEQMIVKKNFLAFHTLYIIKITKTVRTIWLAERRVCTRVCKQGCDIKMFCFSCANHASTKLRKVLSWKTRQVYFIYPFPRRLKLEKSLETFCVYFFSLGLSF